MPLEFTVRQMRLQNVYPPIKASKKIHAPANTKCTVFDSPHMTRSSPDPADYGIDTRTEGLATGRSDQKSDTRFFISFLFHSGRR